MQVITSKDNELVKNIKKLKEKKFRDNNNQFIIEGIKLVAEAIEEKADIENIIVCEDCINNESIDKKLLYEIARYKCIYVTEKIFNTLSDVSNPQGILAVINRKTDNINIDYRISEDDFNKNLKDDIKPIDEKNIHKILSLFIAIYYKLFNSSNILFANTSVIPLISDNSLTLAFFIFSTLPNFFNSAFFLTSPIPSIESKSDFVISLSLNFL